MYAGSVDDLLFIDSKDLVGHCVTNVFADADEVALGFSGFGWKRIIVYLVEDFFPPVETE